jgi:hypothetical protein
MVKLRPARARDVAKVTRYGLPKFVGVVAEENGETIGIGLILFIDGRAMVTFDKTERLRQLPRLMTRIGFILVKAGRKACGDLFVIQDAHEEGSERWLAKLGFQPTDERMAGEKVWKLSH